MRDKKPDKITKNFIKSLIESRKKNGFSHDTMAEKTGLHRSTISLIESEKRSPTLKNCIKLANALGYDLSELLKKAENDD